MAWKGLWWWTRTWETKSASLEASIWGRREQRERREEMAEGRGDLSLQPWRFLYAIEFNSILA